MKFTSNVIDTSSVSTEKDKAAKYVSEFMSLHSKPCQASLETVRKLKEKSVLYSKYKTTHKQEIFTEFDVLKLREYEFKPEELSKILQEKISEIQNAYNFVKVDQEQIENILEREKCQKYFNNQKMAEIKRKFIPFLIFV